MRKLNRTDHEKANVQFCIQLKRKYVEKKF